MIFDFTLTAESDTVNPCKLRSHVELKSLISRYQVKINFQTYQSESFSIFVTERTNQFSISKSLSHQFWVKFPARVWDNNLWGNWKLAKCQQNRSIWTFIFIHRFSEMTQKFIEDLSYLVAVLAILKISSVQFNFQF